jgi:hypothetical protein
VPIETIFVYLLDEGTDVWRPVQAEHVSGDRYRIIGTNSDPDDEHWEFQTGEVVRCEFRDLSGGKCLVAVGSDGPPGRASA